MSFVCNLCNKKFNSLRGLNYHMKKKICEKFKCFECDKIFTRNESLKYHTEKNVCRNSIAPSQLIQCSLNSLNTQKNHPCKLDVAKTKINLKKGVIHKYEDYSKQELLLKVAHLEGENKFLKENPSTKIDNQQINIIVPPAFLQLDTFTKLMKLLPNLLHDALSKHPSEFVSYLIKETNCNPERPLFNCIKIPNKKEPYAQISDGEKYIYAPKKQIISGLIENKKSLLQEYVDKNGDKYGQKVLQRYQNYLDLLDEDSETIKDLEIEITCMLLNISDVIGSDDWSKKLLEDLRGNLI